MTGVTESGLAIELPSRRRRERTPGPISDDEAIRMRIALARVLSLAGYTASDQARILCVSRATLYRLESRVAESPEQEPG